MSALDTKALLARLKALPEGATFGELLAELESSQPKEFIEARRYCALVRGFDEELYKFLTSRMIGAPSLEEMLRSRDFRQVGADRWIVEEQTRSRLLHEWSGPLQKVEWKDWNGRIAHYLQDRARPEDRLDAIYHFCLSSAQAEGVEPFRRWYAEADDAFDLAQCHALLETLRVQSETRGEALSSEWREHERYYRTRLHFIDYYYKSGAYFERTGPLDAFEDVLLRGEQKRWILHLHATGGTGKTMFQRWLISRYLAPRRIPSARLDFDDFDLARATEYPLQLFAKIFQEWAVQVPGDKFNSLVLSLQREESVKGWNGDLLALIRRHLLGAQLETPLVVVLDTLEDVTLTKQAWLEECVKSLRELHDCYPKLLVMLSGRYNILEHCDALAEGEYVIHELSRFSETEAHQYLQHRGIPECKTRDAIVERTAGGEGDDADELRGRNPFKLALFAELALSRSTLTPEDVWAFPRVDVTYLIEKVIRRIKAQPLRWTIRYGVIARHLTKQFMEAVLLPPLRKALRGEVDDQPGSKLAEKFRDVWLPEPTSVESIDVERLWTELAQYSRDRGWISLIGSGDEAELRFHPDVVVPTRQLLKDQPVHAELQELAVQYYERCADAAEDRIQSVVKYLCEAVFHRFQGRGAAARDYWMTCVRRVELQDGPASAARVASEITGRDYASQQREPLAGVMDGPVLAEAHCVTADLLMQAAGAALAPSHVSYPEFIQRIELAHAIERADKEMYVPRLLRVLREALSTPSPQVSIEMLESALKSSTQPRERFFLCLHLARLLRMTAPEQAPVLYMEALATLPSIERAGITAFELSMLLAEVNREIGADEEVRRWFAYARTLAEGDERRLATVSYVEARDALGVDDLETAARGIEELERLPSSTHPRVTALPLLKARLALADYDAPEALRLIATAQEPSPPDLERAQLWDQAGEAQAQCFMFNGAFESWDTAASYYDIAEIQTGSARCALLAARLKATSCGDMLDALAMIEGAAQLRGMQDGELYAEFAMLRCYALYRRRLSSAARTIFSELMSGNQSTWSVALRAKTRLFGLLFTLVEPTHGYIDELLDAIESVRPASMRPGLLDWCGYSDVTLSLPSDARVRLRYLFEDPKSKHAHPRHCINRADLHRIIGDVNEAADLLDSSLRHEVASDWARVYVHWLVQRANRRLGRRTDYVSVLRKAEATGLPKFPLLDAFRIEAAIEAARKGEKGTAERLKDAGFGELLEEGRSVWQGRVLELEAELEQGEGRAARLAQAGEFYTELGDLIRMQAMIIRTAQAQLPGAAASPPSAPASVITEPDFALINVTQSAPALVERFMKVASSHDELIDRLLSDWRPFAEELSEVLYLAPRLGDRLEWVAMRLPSSTESLPWEIATGLAETRLVWRVGTDMVSSLLEPETAPPSRVLLLRPEEGSEISLGSASGASIEHMYLAQGAKVQSLSNPQALHLQEVLRSWQPAVIHINASMVESGHGAYLDFAGKRARTTWVSQKKGGDDTQPFVLEWSPPRLARMIDGARCSPVVVLDVSSEENHAEAIRGLLLRNSYCAQLARYAKCRAVIGVGLGTPWERLPLTEQLVHDLVARTVAEAVAALRGAPGDHRNLQSILPRRGVALWARYPHIHAVSVTP